MVRLGSNYGGWWLYASAGLEGGTILSCGLGEDASFDVEMAARFGCRVIVVDPTPRAVIHFEQTVARCGRPAQLPYAAGGRQDVRSYDLSRVTPDQLVLVEKALSDTTGTVRFYAPKSNDDVSHSIINFQNDYAVDTPFIEVPSLDVSTLLSEVDVGELALAKFDIEGAEIGVLPQLLNSEVQPEQLLVEFDELNWPSRASRMKFDAVHDLVLLAGYEVSYFDRRSCVSYIRR
ncbi:FkbM family methyltransferase [bacterium]|nr:FkbM family methyltransferase [bacterium]